MAKLVPKEEKVQRIKALLEKYKVRIWQTLPACIEPKRFYTLLLNYLNKEKILMDCTPESILGCLLTIAKLGLDPDPITGECYIIPYKDNKNNTYRATFLIGYRGLLKKAYEGNILRDIRARVVYEKDQFKYIQGDNESIEHIPYTKKDRGEIVAVYVVATTHNGGVFRELMWKDQIDGIMARAVKQGKSSPWLTDYEAMAMKTVIRKICKFLPRTNETKELQELVARDELAEKVEPMPTFLEQEIENEKELKELNAPETTKLVSPNQMAYIKSLCFQRNIYLDGWLKENFGIDKLELVPADVASVVIERLQATPVQEWTIDDGYALPASENIIEQIEDIEAQEKVKAINALLFSIKDEEGEKLYNKVRKALGRRAWHIEDYQNALKEINDLLGEKDKLEQKDRPIFEEE